MKTILITHNATQILSFETFDTRKEAQDAAIEIMTDAPSDVRYKIMNEKYFLTLILT